MNPPVPGVDASTKLNDDTHMALPVVSRICSNDTPLSCSFFGSTSTCNCRSRWPQVDTLATPGTPIKRGAMVQRASTDMSISDTVFDDSPIIMTRLVEDKGWSMVGGLDTWGNPTAACVR